MQKLLIYWPMGIFDHTQMHKEIGAIALAAKKKNLDTTVVCGKFEDVDHPFDDFETGMVKSNFLTKIIDPLLTLKVILKKRPDYLLLYRIENYGNIFLILILKLMLIIPDEHKTKLKVFIKSDTDGSFINSRKFFQSLAYKLIILIFIKLTGGIIIETTCALDKISIFIKKKEGLIHIPDGYSKDLFYYSNDNERKNVVICIARITPVKNLEAVIRIYKKISQKFEYMMFKIIGPVIDIEYELKIRNMIDQYGLSDKIELLNPKSEILAEIIRESILSISMSLKESFGIARMESLGCGTPVVTYDIGCGEDFKQYGAIVVPFGDEEAVYTESIKLLSDNGYWRRKSDESRKLSISWDEVVDKLINHFISA